MRYLEPVLQYSRVSVEARDGPEYERLKLGGEMQARARGLQPWIMVRRRRADSA